MAKYASMGGPGIARHACVKTTKCRLKRNKTYAYDAMNILYSICCLSAIADLLVQKPSVPTREIVSAFTYFALLFATHFRLIFVGV